MSSLVQDISSTWVRETFGEECALDPHERGKRVLEEAIELAQASGVSITEVLEVAQYVYKHPVGELHQEVGGVSVTLLSLCTANGLDYELETWREINRVLSLPKEKFLAKRKLKQEAGITKYGG